MNLDGNALVRIVTNQPGRLIAEQLAPDSSNKGNGLMIVILVLVAIGTAIYFARTRYWQGFVVPAALLLFVAFSFYNRTTPSWQMDLDGAQHTMQYSVLSNGKVTSTKTLALGDVSSAEMQFNRGSTRIALILRDGSEVLPLGEQHVQDAPNHYVILTAIRDAIGQVPAR